MTIQNQGPGLPAHPVTDTRSFIPLLLVAAGCLIFAIAVLALPMMRDNLAGVDNSPQDTPAPLKRDVAQIPEPKIAALPQSEAAPETADPADVVTRAQVPLLAIRFTPIDRVTAVAITEQLRQPIRLIDTGVPKRDLPMLTDDVLTILVPDGGQIDPSLREMLIEAVRQRQSDAYIRVLLNTAVERDQIEVPPILRTTTGALDTYSLLKAMAQTVGSPIPKIPQDVDTNGIQKIVEGDSLARLALRYYGQPLKFDLILAANPQIDPQDPVLVPGDVIQMPKP